VFDVDELVGEGSDVIAGEDVDELTCEDADDELVSDGDFKLNDASFLYAFSCHAWNACFSFGASAFF
jgi:hypothetical protein